MIGDEVLHTERTTPESYDLQALFRQMLDAGCTQCGDLESLRFDGGDVYRSVAFGQRFLER